MNDKEMRKLHDILEEEEHDKDLKEFAREMGKKGGKALKDKYGSDYFSEIGKRGGTANAMKGREFFRRIGRLGGLQRNRNELLDAAKKGGEATASKGSEYMRELGKRGAEALRKKKEEDQDG